MEKVVRKEGLKPFLKWAGGKGQLLFEIEKYYPFEGSTIKKYAEPFVGGGAVLFDILSKYNLEKVYISDINKELINAYRIVRDKVEELLSILKDIQNTFIPMNMDERKRYYFEKRERFNILKSSVLEEDDVEKAALLIFLNRTCFNGLFRVNKKGFFNVPMGDYKNPLIYDMKNLRLVSRALQKVEIVCGDYRKSLDFIDADTFVYFDPPYRPISQTSSFTSYTENTFDDEEQKQLAEFVNLVSAKEARILVSNSDPKNIDEEDDFFDRLYASHYIARVDAMRMINSRGNARGKIKELLISTGDMGV